MFPTVDPLNKYPFKERQKLLFFNFFLTFRIISINSVVENSLPAKIRFFYLINPNYLASHSLTQELST